MPEPSTARYHVLLIGIDGYARDPLAGCVNDVDDIAELLSKQPFWVPAASIRKLVAPRRESQRQLAPNEEAPTYDAIVQALEDLASKSVQPQDRVVVYYSGHGSYERIPQGATYFEGLVPLDRDVKGLLYDVELNPLLQAIAQAGGDLTVVLDCCHSAGATRDTLPGLPGMRVRFSEPAARSDASPPPGVTRLARKLVPSPSSAAEEYTVIAACHANQRAAECALPRGSARPHGILTYCLLELLKRQDEKSLAKLRWNDIWELLKVSVMGLNPAQDPQILGPRERRLFGGPWQPQDLGYAITRNEDGTYTVGAGSLAGLAPGAELAVYGPEPPRFPPLNSPADWQARRGVLRIESVELGRSSAAPAQKGMVLDGLEAIRGRLIKIDAPDRLRVALDSDVEESIQKALLDHQPSDRFVILPPNDPRAEVQVGQFPQGDLWIGDDLYAPNDPSSPGALVTVSRSDALNAAGLVAGLRAGLNHYAHYVVPLRLCRHSGFTLPDKAIDVRVFDCNGLKNLQELEQDLSLRHEANRDSRGRYSLHSGDQVVFHVANLRALSDLYVSLLLCNLEGQIQVLETNVMIKPRSGKIFWYDGIKENTFEMLCPSGRNWGVDRLVIIATDEPTIDLSSLDQEQTLGDAIRTAMETRCVGSRSARSPCGTHWTAVQVAIKVEK